MTSPLSASTGTVTFNSVEVVGLTDTFLSPAKVTADTRSKCLPCKTTSFPAATGEGLYAITSGFKVEIATDAE